MKFKDYYQIMNVAPEASADDIKKAYRKLAHKYHPDVSKEKNAEEKFKEVGEAYEVLKDPEKRAKYDQLRKGGWQAEQEFKPSSGAGGFHYETHGQGGRQDFSDFFESLFGRAEFRNAGRGHRPQYQTRGQDLYYKISVSVEDVYHGTTQSLQLRIPEADAQGHVRERTKTLNVKIPAGIMQGQQIRLQGQGAPGIAGGPAGDLFLEIDLKSSALYHVEGRDITITLPITPWEAALGTTITVPTLGGKIELKVPPHSQAGQKLRLKQRGLPGNPAGDQYVLLKVILPDADNEEKKSFYRQMAEVMPFNPRANLEGF